VHENHELDMPLALEMVRQLRLEEEEEDNFEQDSLNQRMTDQSEVDEVQFCEPLIKIEQD
jgi:hypothetical protein